MPANWDRGWREPRDICEQSREAGGARWGADVQEEKPHCSTGGCVEIQISRINKIGHVQANGRGGNKFPRVQPIGEPFDDPPEGGEGDCLNRMSKGGSYRTAERFGAHRSVQVIERPRHQRRRREFSRTLRFFGHKG